MADILGHLGALFGLTSVIITMIMPQARIWLTMARDGLLPKMFGPCTRASVHRTSPRSSPGRPRQPSVDCCRSDILGELVSIGTLIAFIVVCVGVLVLRYTRPDLHRPFRVRGIWAISSLGVLFCGAMAYSLPSATWLAAAGVELLGFAIYFLATAKQGQAEHSRRCAAPPAAEAGADSGQRVELPS